MDNKINFQLPEEVATQVLEKTTEIVALLKPYLIGLTPDERKVLPKMSDGTSPFVEKCLDYCDSDPQFAPPFMSVQEFQADLKTWEQLMTLLRPLRQVYQDLDDTVMQAGSESYTAALSYYNSVKLATRMSIPGSKAIYDDLKRRFEKNGPHKTVATTA
ncbi:hypothetical protein [Gaoshiqia sediminis]|uniref:Uncharacterized protein n=1 Tax=Gaoshiqia sediminis TaxID=2986998 RepID=A0AA41Y7B3_9BACT|nr:hypothetical protein [Gaoshiqia sediminis]MCW0482801.1 hypothetical protein [Gaoshiqia sediminis]